MIQDQDTYANDMYGCCSAPSWCSACASVSEGVFLMYPWRAMYSISTYTSATLFSKAYFLKLYFSQCPLMETSLPACSKIAELRGLPGGFDGKEFDCNAEDLCLIPG